MSRATHYYFPFLSFICLFIYFSEILFLGCFFRQASFLVTKNHLPKYELERGEGVGMGVCVWGGRLNRVPMLELVLCLKTISF